MERALTGEFSSDKKYSYELRNQQTIRVYSRDFSAAYHRELDGMVERRMRLAIRRIGSYWYTAWKAAGSPDLSALSGIVIPPEPEEFEPKFQIIDREALGTQWLFAPSCCGHRHRSNAPAALPMGWRRTVACVEPPVGFPAEAKTGNWLTRTLQWLAGFW
jgi:hypothetical protein